MHRQILLSLLCYCFLFCTNAQSTRIEMENILTNGTARNWSFDNYTISLGGGCTGNGQLYTFFKGGKLQRRVCRNGTADFKQLYWKLTLVDSLHSTAWQLELSEPLSFGANRDLQKVRIDFPSVRRKASGETMIWRYLPFCQGCPEEKVLFSSIQ